MISQQRIQESPQPTAELGLREKIQSLEAALRYARGVSDTMREAFLVLDSSLKVVSANRSFYETFKVSPQKTVGQAVFDLGNRQWDIPDLRRLLQEILPHNAVLNDFEVEHDFEGIGRRIMLLNARRLYVDTIPSEMILLAIEDVTERRQAERVLSQYRQGLEAVVRTRTEELARSNAALQEEVQRHKQTTESLADAHARAARHNRDLEQMAYAISHDLHEPLRTINGFLGALQRHYGHVLDAKASEYIGFVTSAATRMGRLLDDLLAYTRVSSPRMTLSQVDCEKVLDGVHANLKATIEETRAVVSHDAMPTVLYNEAHLTQLLQNLIGNAVKYHGKEPPRIHVGANRIGEEWIFSVKDNGIGIEPRQFDRIFQIFQRLHPLTAYSGTGIGLAICKRIVEDHGGRIWVESQPGLGSTFFFTIPERQPNAAGVPVAG